MRRKYFCTFFLGVIILIGDLPVFAQTQNENAFDWSNTSPDGNWSAGSGNRWWNPAGSYDMSPTANRKLRFNNNNQTTTYNNMSNGFQIYQLIFDGGSSSDRTVNGNSVVFNPDYNLGNTVKVENYSSATHTVNLAISRGGGNGDLQLNPVNGNLVFNNSIDNGGKTINIWGNNSKTVEFNNVIQGSGEFNIRQYSIVKFNAGNTYTGGTALYQGELWIMANGGISSSSSIWLGNGCCASNVTKLFLADWDGGQNFSNQINFNYGDAGNQVLGGLNNAGTNTFSGNNISISPGKTLTIEEVSSTGTLEFSNGISGGGSINLVGSGTTVFTGANTYTGLTTVSGGTLRLNRTGGTTLPTTNNVTVTSGTLRISSNQELNDLTVSSGGTLTIDAGVTLTIGGTFTGGGAIVNNGTLILKGNSSFPGSTTTITTLNNLTINRSAGVTLDKNVTVAGVLTLTDGKLSLGNYDLTISGSISGVASTRFIATNGTGVLKTNIGNNASFAFPVGNTTYNPVTITNKTGTADDFSVRVINEVYADGSSSGSTVPANRVQRTWDISKTTASANAGSGVDLVFNWDPATQTSAVLSVPKMHHYESAAWTNKSSSGNTTFDVVGGTMTFIGYKGSFSPFAIMEDGLTLPASWVSFTAKLVRDVVQLDWSTASEHNTKDFDVQYSTNGLNWSTLGTITAAGNSNAIKQYSFTYAKPSKQNTPHYYRIAQRDLDGKLSYSKIANLIFNVANDDMFVYPNPAKGNVTIYLTESQDVKLINAAGVTVWRGSLTAGTNQLALSNHAKGVYTIVTRSTIKQLLIQ